MQSKGFILARDPRSPLAPPCALEHRSRRRNLCSNQVSLADARVGHRTQFRIQRAFCVYLSINSETGAPRRFSAHLDQDARNAGWSDPSSSENNTGIISFVLTLPFGSFSATTSCWAPGRPTGITILPPALSWLIRGGGIRSGAAVTITLSNGACSGQPVWPSPTRTSTLV